MATVLNIAKEAIKTFKEAKCIYNQAIIATYANSNSIAIYHNNKMEAAICKVSEAKGKVENTIELLEKDSKKREEYENKHNELIDMSNKISKL